MLLHVFVTNLSLETATIGAQNALGFPRHLSGDPHGITALTRWIGKADHQAHFAQCRNLRGEGGRIIRRLIIDLDRLVNRRRYERYQVLDFDLALLEGQSVPLGVVHLQALCQQLTMLLENAPPAFMVGLNHRDQLWRQIPGIKQNQRAGHAPFDRVCDQWTGQGDLGLESLVFGRKRLISFQQSLLRLLFQFVALFALLWNLDLGNMLAEVFCPSGHFVVTTISTQIDGEAHSPAQGMTRNGVLSYFVTPIAMVIVAGNMVPSASDPV